MDRARAGLIRPITIAFLICVGTASGGSARAAGSEAVYSAVFDATWSAATHPVDFPPGPHFSGLIGGTHNDTVSFWDVAGLASNGIERMAELGSKSPLDNAVLDAIDSCRAQDLISGAGIGPSPGSVSVSFTATQQHPLVTLVSMIAPSPDWFVGVSSLNLFENGSWVEELIVGLLPYDAGTDSGVTYLSPNANTAPPQPISQILSEPFPGATPLGTFTFTLISESGEEPRFCTTSAQRRCINKLNGGGARVAKAKGRVIRECIKGAAKERLTSSIEDCVTADSKGRVARAMQRTLEKEAGACKDAEIRSSASSTGARSVA